MPALKLKSRAITAHVVMQTGQYPVIHGDHYEFPARDGVGVKSEREWERSYQAAAGSLSDFNQLLKSLGDGQRTIRLHSKKGANNG